MRIFAISDLHLSFSTDKPMDIFGAAWEGHFTQIKEDWQSRVSQDDVVLIAGDISWAMSLADAKKDLDELGKLNGNIFLIRGNHDYWWNGYSKVKSILPDNVFCIQNNAVKHGAFVICGTRGWTVPERADDAEDKYVNRELLRLDMSLKEAKRLATDGEKIILMMHYPPFNSKFEDSVFTDLIASYGITTVVYGHLHGENIRFKLKVNKGVTDYYLTSCDLLKNKLLELTDLL
ncbi:MAG: metallophosphoesterase [Clostridia bacterium]|nr:metallophosphoesterase [Clostridia bacterium]